MRLQRRQPLLDAATAEADAEAVPGRVVQVGGIEAAGQEQDPAVLDQTAAEILDAFCPLVARKGRTGAVRGAPVEERRMAAEEAVQGRQVLVDDGAGARQQPVAVAQGDDRQPLARRRIADREIV